MPIQGSRLLARREALGLSQPEVCKLMGIKNYQQYAQWETGEHEPLGRNIEKLMKALSCSADYLFGLVDDPGDTFKEADLSPNERKLIALIRQDRKDEAAMYVLSGGVAPPPSFKPYDPPLIEGGDKPSVPGSDEAA
jgi:transcriptional regulator with XRE-family HTH domain